MRCKRSWRTQRLPPVKVIRSKTSQKPKKLGRTQIKRTLLALRISRSRSRNRNQQLRKPCQRPFPQSCGQRTSKRRVRRIRHSVRHQNQREPKESTGHGRRRRETRPYQQQLHHSFLSSGISGTDSGMGRKRTRSTCVLTNIFSYRGPMIPTIVHPGELNSATIKSIQQELKEAGYSPGPADGRWGARTKVAYSNFLVGTHRRSVVPFQ